MSHEWINADLALKYVAYGGDEYAARRAIAKRAHMGLLAAKAETVIWGDKREHDHLLGKRFWRAEGGEALKQNWQSGDFSTWIDDEVEVIAFDVSFDFAGLTDFLAAEQRPLALRAVSVLGQPDWISAKALFALMLENYGPAHGSKALLEACRLGQIAGRAMRATANKIQLSHSYLCWRHLEWDIPFWFWRDFTDPAKSVTDWKIDRVQGEGIVQGRSHRIELQGVHFHRSGLINLGFAPAPVLGDAPLEAKRGRRPEYDWPAATAEIWGQIYRGELTPKSQAMIEKAFQALLAKGDKEPSESTVRPFARPIWKQIQKA